MMMQMQRLRVVDDLRFSFPPIYVNPVTTILERFEQADRLVSEGKVDELAKQSLQVYSSAF